MADWKENENERIHALIVAYLSDPEVRKIVEAHVQKRVNVFNALAKAPSLQTSKAIRRKCGRVTKSAFQHAKREVNRQLLLVSGMLKLPPKHPITIDFAGRLGPKAAYFGLRLKGISDKEATQKILGNIRPGTDLARLYTILRQEALNDLRRWYHCPTLDDYRRLTVTVCQEFDDDPWATEDFNFSRLFQPDGNFLIISDLGTGKSAFLRYLQIKMTDHAKVVPFIFEAVSLEKMELTRKALMNVLSDRYQSTLKCGNSFFDDLFDHRAMVFLIDGLDQIQEDNPYNFVRRLREAIRLNKMIIASRPTIMDYIDESFKLTKLSLKPFTVRDQKKYFGENYSQCMKFIQLDKRLGQIPILAYMVKSLVETKRNRVIRTQTDLYVRYIHQLFHEHLPNRGQNYKDFSFRDFRLALEEISFLSIAAMPPQWQRVDTRRLKPSNPISMEAIRQIGLTNLVIEHQPVDDYTIWFIHQSFQEFLAACWITRSKNEHLQDKIIKEMSDSRWKEVLKFTTGILKEPFLRRIYPHQMGGKPEPARLFVATESAGEISNNCSTKLCLFQHARELLDDLRFADKVLRSFLHLNCPESLECLNRVINQDLVLTTIADRNYLVNLLFNAMEKSTVAVDDSIINQLWDLMLSKSPDLWPNDALKEHALNIPLTVFEKFLDQFNYPVYRVLELIKRMPTHLTEDHFYLVKETCLHKNDSVEMSASNNPFLNLFWIRGGVEFPPDHWWPLYRPPRRNVGLLFLANMAPSLPPNFIPDLVRYFDGPDVFARALTIETLRHTEKGRKELLKHLKCVKGILSDDQYLGIDLIGVNALLSLHHKLSSSDQDFLQNYLIRVNGFSPKRLARLSHIGRSDPAGGV